MDIRKEITVPGKYKADERQARQSYNNAIRRAVSHRRINYYYTLIKRNCQTLCFSNGTVFERVKFL